MGDPGTHEAILSLEDPILDSSGGGFAVRLSGKIFREGSEMSNWLAKRAIVKAQKRLERSHASIRKNLLLEDDRKRDMLSFSGHSE
jgi:preprotein translocase subunit SecA